MNVEIALCLQKDNGLVCSSMQYNSQNINSLTTDTKLNMTYFNFNNDKQSMGNFAFFTSCGITRINFIGGKFDG